MGGHVTGKIQLSVKTENFPKIGSKTIKHLF